MSMEVKYSDKQNVHLVVITNSNGVDYAWVTKDHKLTYNHKPKRRFSKRQIKKRFAGFLRYYVANAPTDELLTENSLLGQSLFYGRLDRKEYRTAAEGTAND